MYADLTLIKKRKNIGIKSPMDNKVIGHSYVKKRYIKPTNYGKRVYRDEVSGNTIGFIPATVYDNLAIMMNDPAYVRRLENLPPKKRQAYLLGDWDMYDGQAFEEFDPKIHILNSKTTKIEDHWYRWIGVDNGYTDPFAWYWYAVDEYGLVYIYREFTRYPYQPKMTYSDQAKKVLELSAKIKVDEMEAYKVNEPIGVVYAGHDAFASHPLAAGKTIAHYYQQAGLGPIIASIPDRRLRKATWHEYLAPFEFNGEMVAKVRILDCCDKLIETLPQLSEDEKDPEKVEECSIDHWYDGAGYGLVSYHINKSERIPTKVKDPLPWPLRTEEKIQGNHIDPYTKW